MTTTDDDLPAEQGAERRDFYQPDSEWAANVSASVTDPRYTKLSSTEPLVVAIEHDDDVEGSWILSEQFLLIDGTDEYRGIPDKPSSDDGGDSNAE